jgi:hypothetical protein
MGAGSVHVEQHRHHSRHHESCDPSLPWLNVTLARPEAKEGFRLVGPLVAGGLNHLTGDKAAAAAPAAAAAAVGSTGSAGDAFR